MKEFDDLLHVAEKLLGPQGCDWDKKQTFHSLQPYILEEAHEVIEAVDLDDDRKIREELGDLLYTIIFYGKLAEKKGRFSIAQVLSAIKEKLVRRHPHVFADVKVENVDEIVSNWEKIKKQEKGSAKTQDAIPSTLPGLVRGQKMLKKMKRSGFALPEKGQSLTEEEIGEQLLHLLMQANQSEVDAESALRRALNQLMQRFSKWQEQNLSNEK